MQKIRHDEESKTNFDSGGYMQLCPNQNVPNLYPNMSKKNFFKLPIALPTLYLVEAGWSAVNEILTKKRNA